MVATPASRRTGGASRIDVPAAAPAFVAPLKAIP